MIFIDCIQRNKIIRVAQLLNNNQIVHRLNTSIYKTFIQQFKASITQ